MHTYTDSSVTMSKIIDALRILILCNNLYRDFSLCVYLGVRFCFCSSIIGLSLYSVFLNGILQAKHKRIVYKHVEDIKTMQGKFPQLHGII